MPASRDSVAVTDRYRARLLTLREQSAQLAARSWLALDLSDLDASYATWLASMTGLVEGMKRTGVQLTDAYVAAFVASELGTAPEATGIDPEPYLDTADGRSIEKALLPPLYTVKMAASRGREDALRLGMNRATRTVSEEVFDAPQRALGDLATEHPRITGWRRVISARPCGACLASATGDVHPSGDPFRRHGHCRCTREPVVRGVRERHHRKTGPELYEGMTPEERAALFHGRGGAAKAQLVDSGAVPLEALVKREPMAVGPDQYTEASLADLRSMATAPVATAEGLPTGGRDG